MATAAGVATVSAVALFPAAQLEIRALAAASAPGFNAEGGATVVVVVVARAADEVVVARCARVECVDTT